MKRVEFWLDLATVIVNVHMGLVRGWKTWRIGRRGDEVTSRRRWETTTMTSSRPQPTNTQSNELRIGSCGHIFFSARYLFPSRVSPRRRRICLRGRIARRLQELGGLIVMLRSIQVVNSCSRDHVILVITSSRLANGTHF